jgi:hypothetical protein
LHVKSPVASPWCLSRWQKGWLELFWTLKDCVSPAHKLKSWKCSIHSSSTKPRNLYLFNLGRSSGKQRRLVQSKNRVGYRYANIDAMKNSWSSNVAADNVQLLQVAETLWIVTWAYSSCVLIREGPR